MINSDRDRCAGSFDRPIQGFGDVLATEGTSRLKQRTLTTKLIDHGEHAKWLAIEHLIMNKIHAPSLVRALLAGERAPMTAGTQRRDFMHVADAGAAFAALAGSALTGAVNVASGEGVELRELASLIAAHCGGPELLGIGELPMRDGDPPSLVADAARLHSELGFQPRLSLDAGLRDTIAWWQAR